MLYMYIFVFRRLGLHEQDLTTYEGEDLLAFNDYSTHPRGAMESPVSAREGKSERIMNKYGDHSSRARCSGIHTLYEDEISQ